MSRDAGRSPAGGGTDSVGAARTGDRHRGALAIAVVVVLAAGCGHGAAGAARPPKRPAGSPSTPAATTPAATTPAGGGTPAIPTPAPVVAASSAQPAVIDPRWAPVAGDGIWAPAGPLVAGSPALYTTRIQATAASGPVALAWLDTHRLSLALYAGVGEPAGIWPNEAAVAAALQPRLAATFNAGFKLNSSEGGWYLAGRSAVPLRSGAASLVIYADGSATVGAWDRDATLTSNVVAVRQNLQLLVDGGQAAATISTNVLSTWGATLNHLTTTWRSGIGVDIHGDLIYAAGPYLDPAGLAAALIAAGTIRAMELDINPEWVSFDSFSTGPNGIVGTKLLPTMYFSTGHFLAPTDRDFFAAFTRG